MDRQMEEILMGKRKRWTCDFCGRKVRYALATMDGRRMCKNFCYKTRKKGFDEIRRLMGEKAKERRHGKSKGNV